MSHPEELGPGPVAQENRDASRRLVDEGAIGLLAKGVDGPASVKRLSAGLLCEQVDASVAVQALRRHVRCDLSASRPERFGETPDGLLLEPPIVGGPHPPFGNGALAFRDNQVQETIVVEHAGKTGHQTEAGRRQGLDGEQSRQD